MWVRVLSRCSKLKLGGHLLSSVLGPCGDGGRGGGLLEAQKRNHWRICDGPDLARVSYTPGPRRCRDRNCPAANPLPTRSLCQGKPAARPGAQRSHAGASLKKSRDCHWTAAVGPHCEYWVVRRWPAAAAAPHRCEASNAGPRKWLARASSAGPRMVRARNLGICTWNANSHLRGSAT